MPIDPNIALGVRQTEQPNMLNQMAQVMQMRALQQDYQSQNALSESYKNAYAGGKFDPQAVIRGLVESGQGHMVPKVEAQMLKAEQERAATKKTTVETLGKEYENLKMGLQNVSDEAGYLNWVAAGFNNPAIAAHMKEVGLTPDTALNNAKATVAKEGLQAAIAKSAMGLDNFTKLDLQNKNAVQVAHIRNAPAFARLAAEQAPISLTPDAVDMAAHTYLRTGQLPPMGIGKNAAATKTAIMNRATELAMNPNAPPTAAPGGAAPPTAAPGGAAPPTAAPGGAAPPTAAAPTGAAANEPPKVLVPRTAKEASDTVVTNKQDTKAQGRVLNAFTSGVEGRRVTAINTAVNHLDTMTQLTAALENGDTKAINAAANVIAKQTGAPAPTNFDAAKQIVAAEVIKAVVANGGTGKEREEAANNINTANSPAQLAGVIKTYQELMAGQLDSLKVQYTNGTGRNDFDKKFLTESSRKLFTPAESKAAPQMSAQDQAALDWANANASDPRAAEIKKRLGVK